MGMSVPLVGCVGVFWLIFTKIAGGLHARVQGGLVVGFDLAYHGVEVSYGAGSREHGGLRDGCIRTRG